MCNNNIINLDQLGDPLAGGTLRGGPSSGGASTGLDLIQTKLQHEKIYYFRNKKTGEMIASIPKINRLRRLRKKIFAWADTFDQIEKRQPVKYLFMGITYKPGETWEPKHITEFIQKMKRRVGSDKIIGYAWVGEMQKRGSPHYHILWAVKPGTFIPFADKSGLWKHGNSHNSVWMSNKPYYICKYLSKLHTKTEFPRGFRIHGTYIKPEIMTQAENWSFHLTNFPSWLKQTLVDDNLIGLIPVKNEFGPGWKIGRNIVISDWYRVGSDHLCSLLEAKNKGQIDVYLSNGSFTT